MGGSLIKVCVSVRGTLIKKGKKKALLKEGGGVHKCHFWRAPISKNLILPHRMVKINKRVSVDSYGRLTRNSRLGTNN